MLITQNDWISYGCRAHKSLIRCCQVMTSRQIGRWRRLLCLLLLLLNELLRLLRLLLLQVQARVVVDRRCGAGQLAPQIRVGRMMLQVAEVMRIEVRRMMRMMWM